MPKPFKCATELDLSRLIAVLREDRCIEYPLVGWDGIADWCVRMRYTMTRPKPCTLQKWRREFGCPITHSPRSTSKKRHPWTTNLLMQAWAVTSGRALSLPRWHPIRMKVTGKRYIKPAKSERVLRRKADQAAVAEAIRRKLIASGDASRAGQDSGPVSSGPA